MLTRRQLLVSAGVLGAAAAPIASAVALPPVRAGRHVLRLGILQSVEPFIDAQDLRGARQRAFAAFRLLLERTVDGNEPLDWLAAGAFPLSGPGPFPSPVLAQLALNSQSDEVAWLARFARRHRLQLTLGAWWRGTGLASHPRLLLFERDGNWQAARTAALVHAGALQGVNLQLCESPFGEPDALAASCRQLGVYGAHIEPARSPATPPTIRVPYGGASKIFAPDGSELARALTQGETCVVARLAA